MPSPGEALDIRYVRNGDVSIAYHVVGDGPADLVLVPDFFSNLVFDWEAGHWRPFYERLARSFRLILFDKRGTGLSDRGPLFPNLETRMEDVRAVLDAVGSQRAVIFGGHEGSTMACLYAATYPERTVALVLWQAAALQARSSSGSATVATFGSRAMTTGECSCHPRSSRRSNGSPTRSSRSPSRRPCWRPSSSPTSSARPSERASLATVNGPSYSPVTTPRSDNSSDGSAAGRSTPRATGSLRASTDRLGRSAALAPSPSWCTSSASKCASVSTGECEIVSGKPTGIAVNTGARVAAAAAAGEVLVTGTVKDLVAGSGISFEDRGERELKGVGAWRLYSVVSA
jgi:pimeloyl-ACP methyl ester carboxylesterase